MALITIKIADAHAAALDELTCRCNSSHLPFLTSHGPLDTERLLTMLAEDAAAVTRRPTSWEASGIIEVLRRHGYFF